MAKARRTGASSKKSASKGTSEVAAVVDALEEAVALHRERFGGGLLVRGRPASDAAIEALRAEWGALPPSYEALLRHCDGLSDFDHRPNLVLFDTATLLGEAGRAFAAEFRARRGLRTAKAIQRGRIVGGSPSCGLFFDTTQPKAGAELPLFERGRDGGIGGGTVLAYLRLKADGLRYLVETDETERRDREHARTPGGLAKLLADAVETFNYPNEMGEDVWESVEGLNELAARLPASASRERRVLETMARELANPATEFGEARIVERAGAVVIELRLDDTWVPVPTQ